MRKNVVPTLFAAMLVVTACAHTNEAPNWKSIENDAFSFSAPPEFQKRNERGTDSIVEVYVSEGVVLIFDYLINSRYPKSSGDEYTFYNWPAETAFEDIRISGKPARIGMAKYEIYPEHPYSVSVHIDTEMVTLTASAACKSEDEFAIAKRIIETISFKASKSSL